MRGFKKFTINMIAIINVVAILLLLFVGYSDRFHPANHPLLSCLGLTFPAFLLVNVGFLVFWAIFKLRMCIIPAVGFLLAYAPMRAYIPFNFSQDIPDGAIKVMSYNVHLFVGWDEDIRNRDSLLQYIKHQDADILCLQESKIPNEELQKVVDTFLGKIYPYHAMADKPGTEDRLSLYSKFPILNTERIPYPDSQYFSTAHKVLIGKDTVTVINNHLFSTGLSKDERESFSRLFNRKVGSDSIRSTSRKLQTRLSTASKFRSREVDAVARYIDEHPDESIILCGDFNDCPISYTHHRLTRKLNDCFVESGRGVGVSFNRSRLYVRIDYILSSSDWQSYNCQVDNKIKISDHYPVFCWLKKRDK